MTTNFLREPTFLDDQLSTRTNFPVTTNFPGRPTSTRTNFLREPTFYENQLSVTTNFPGRPTFCDNQLSVRTNFLDNQLSTRTNFPGQPTFCDDNQLSWTTNFLREPTFLDNQLSPKPTFLDNQLSTRTNFPGQPTFYENQLSWTTNFLVMTNQLTHSDRLTDDQLSRMLTAQTVIVVEDDYQVPRQTVLLTAPTKSTDRLTDRLTDSLTDRVHCRDCPDRATHSHTTAVVVQTNSPIRICAQQPVFAPVTHGQIHCYKHTHGRTARLRMQSKKSKTDFYSDPHTRPLAAHGQTEHYCTFTLTTSRPVVQVHRL